MKKKKKKPGPTGFVNLSPQRKAFLLDHIFPLLKRELLSAFFQDFLVACLVPRSLLHMTLTYGGKKWILQGSQEVVSVLGLSKNLFSQLHLCRAPLALEKASKNEA
jgi:hypothetical protein